MKIVQKVMMVVLSLGFSFFNQADEPAKDINIHVGFGMGQEHHQSPQDSTGATTGKVVGSAAFAIGTGAAMAAALPLVKNSEALTSLYVVVAGVLLYSQRETIKNAFGPAYTSFATWVSTVSMIGFGLGAIALERQKIVLKPAGKSKKA